MLISMHCSIFALQLLQSRIMPENKVIIYTANDAKTKIDVKLEEETL
ncbi:MAG: hypothetical protein IKU98_09010 [Bacteroidaceae bacterium]|nr:hypothetical protein [Bacteroidaceae bacterium]